MPLFVADIVPDIPDRFWKIPYDIAHDRDSATLMELKPAPIVKTLPTNCYGTLAGRYPISDQAIYGTIPSHTITVDQYQPLDLLLFSPTHNAWGAHVAVHVGNDRAIHLSRRVGLAAVWPLAQFAEYPQYRVLLGGKRALFTNSDRSF